MEGGAGVVRALRRSGTNSSAEQRWVETTRQGALMICCSKEVPKKLVSYSIHSKRFVSSSSHTKRVVSNSLEACLIQLIRSGSQSIRKKRFFLGHFLFVSRDVVSSRPSADFCRTRMISHRTCCMCLCVYVCVVFCGAYADTART